MARLDGYEFGRVMVDGEEQTRDVIVLPGRIVSNWWRSDGHSLVLNDLDDVLDELPERFVVGSLPRIGALSLASTLPARRSTPTTPFPLRRPQRSRGPAPRCA